MKTLDVQGGVTAIGLLSEQASPMRKADLLRELAELSERAAGAESYETVLQRLRDWQSTRRILDVTVCHILLSEAFRTLAACARLA